MLCASLVTAWQARADFTQDDDEGVAIDTLTSNIAIVDGPNAPASLVGGGVRLTPVDSNNPDESGSFTTKVIPPDSYSSFNRLYIKASGTPRSGQTTPLVTVEVLSATGSVLGQGALPLITSDDPTYTSMADLSWILASAQPSGIALRFTLREGAISPAVDQYKVTWFPYSKLAISYSAADTVCSGASIKHQIRLAVNDVKARDVLVTLPLATGSGNVPAGQTTATFVESTRLSMQTSVPAAGSTGATPITLASGQVVPAFTAYFYFASIDPGHTFQLLVTTVSPLGTLTDTTYTLKATAKASNAATVDSNSATTRIQNSPSRNFLKRTVSGIYRIQQTDYATPGTKLGFDLTLEQPYSGNCAETYYNVAVWDQLDYLSNKGKAPFVMNGSDIVVEGIDDTDLGGRYTSNGTTVYTSGSTAAPVSIPAKSVYWQIPRIEVGQSKTVHFVVTLKDSSTFPELADNVAKDYFDNVGHANSGFAPQVQQRDASTRVTIYPPQNPYGIYRKGDRIHGFASASAANNDNPYSTVTYGDQIGWILAVDNNGFSELVGHYFFDLLPAEVELVGVNAPAGATVYYTADATSSDPNAPPGFNPASFNPATQPNPALALNTSVWTPAANFGAPAGAKWVAVYVPSVGSIFLQGQPNVAASSASIEITTRVKPPTSACAEFTTTNVGKFTTLGYRTQSGALKVAGLSATDSEPVQVRAILPSFEQTSAYASPNVRVGPGPVSYVVTIPNQHNGGDPTDTALNMKATVTFPKVTVNGVDQYLPITSTSGCGSAVITPGKASFDCGSAAPGEVKQIVVTVAVPRGMLDGASIPVAAAVVADDDVCGKVQGGSGATATVIAKPHLKAVEQTLYEVVAADVQGQPPVINDFPLTYANIGDAAATGSFVADRLPANMVLHSVVAPAGVKVLFSNKSAPTVPADESTWNLSAAQITAPNFLPGIVIGNVAGGIEYQSPFWNANAAVPTDSTTWVVALTDDPTLHPPELPTFSSTISSQIVVRATVAAGTPANTVITNRGVIGGNDLIPSQTNLVRLVVSPRAGLTVNRSCSPGVVAGGEAIHLVSHYTNNSTNHDTTASFTETLPPEAIIDSVHITVANELGQTQADITATAAQLPTAGISYSATSGVLTYGYNGFNPQWTLDFDVAVHLDGVETGDSVFFGGTGVADNEVANPTYATGSCAILVANPDLVSTKLVDIARPVNGDRVTFTVTVSNIGAHPAKDVVLTDHLPSRFEYAGGVMVLTPGWTFQGGGQPQPVGGDLVWSSAYGNALVRTDASNADFPGGSGDVTFQYQAYVREPHPDRDITNCIDALQGPGGFTEDSDVATNEFANNSSCVTVHTPFPDLVVTKSAPLDALGGDEIAYTLTYANHSRQPAQDAFIADKLPDWAGDGAPPASAGLPDGKADVIVTSISGGNGEDAWSNNAPLGATPPAFPGNGWTTSPSGVPNWVGIHIATVPGAGTAGAPAVRNVVVRATLRNPRNQLLPRPGTSYVNCAFIGSDTSDDNVADNGPACATTTIPGVDLAVDKQCGAPCVTVTQGRRAGDTTTSTIVDTTCIDPTIALRPGDQVSVILTASNTGTENVYAIHLKDSFPSQLVVQSAALAAEVTTLTGGAAYAVDAQGRPITDSLNWTPAGDGWVLGTSDQSGHNYQTVGLAPRTQAKIIVVATVAQEVTSDTIVVNSATVAMEQSGAKPEEYLVNNSDGCQLKVVRPDVRTSKSVTDVNGGTGPVGSSSNVIYTVAYNNVGKAPANDVRISDVTPDGTFIVPSSFADLPAGSSVVFYDAGGAVIGDPIQNGLADPRVASFELLLADPTPAPLGDTFREDAAFNGTFVGTADIGGAVVATGGGVQPTYTTPLIPTTEGDLVTGWLLVTLNDRSLIQLGNEPVKGGLNGPFKAGDIASQPFLVTVLSADGAAIGGYENVPVDGSGTIDISGIPAADHPGLKVRITFPAVGATDSLVPVKFQPLGTPLPPAEVWLQDGKWAYGLVSRFDNQLKKRLAVKGNQGQQRPVLAAWHKEEGQWLLDQVQHPELEDFGDISEIMWGGQGAVLTRNQWNGFLELWHKVGGDWKHYALADRNGTPLQYWGNAQDITTCEGSSCVDTCGFDGCPLIAWYMWYPQQESGLVRYDAANDQYRIIDVVGPVDSDFNPAYISNCYPYEVNRNGLMLGYCASPSVDGWHYFTMVWRLDVDVLVPEVVNETLNYSSNIILLTKDDQVILSDYHYNESTNTYDYSFSAFTGSSGTWSASQIGPTFPNYAYAEGRRDKYLRPDEPVVSAQFYDPNFGQYHRGLFYEDDLGAWQFVDIDATYGSGTTLTDVGYRLGLGNIATFGGQPGGIDIFGSDTRAITDTSAIARYILSSTAAWGESNDTNDTNTGWRGLPARPTPTTPTRRRMCCGWAGHTATKAAPGSRATLPAGTTTARSRSVRARRQRGLRRHRQRGQPPGNWRTNYAGVWELRIATPPPASSGRGSGLEAATRPTCSRAPSAASSAWPSSATARARCRAASTRCGAIRTATSRRRTLDGCPQGSSLVGVTPDGVPFGNCTSNNGQYTPVTWSPDGLGGWQYNVLPLELGNVRLERWDERLGAIVGYMNQYYDANFGMWFYQVEALWIPNGSGGFDSVVLIPHDAPSNSGFGQPYIAWERSGNRISAVSTYTGQYLPVVWENQGSGWAPTVLDNAGDFGNQQFEDSVLLAPNGDAVFQTYGGPVLYRYTGAGWTPFSLFDLGTGGELGKPGDWQVVNIVGPGASGVPTTTTRVLLHADSISRYAVAELDAGGTLAFNALPWEVNWLEAAPDATLTYRTVRAGYLVGYGYPNDRQDALAVSRGFDGSYDFTIIRPAGIDGLYLRGWVGKNVVYGTAVGGDELEHLIFLRNDPDGSSTWKADDVTPSGYEFADNQDDLALALSDSGVGVAWFTADGNDTLELFKLVPSANVTHGGGTVNEAPSIDSALTYAPAPLGISESSNDEPLSGQFVSSECWILDEGLYFWNCGSGTGSLTLDNLAVSYVAGDPSFTFQAEVQDTCLTSIENRVSISTVTPEITLANNEGFATIGVKHADLAVTIEPDATVAESDYQIQWHVAVTNHGPDAVTSAHIEFTPPDGNEASLDSGSSDDMSDLQPNETRDFYFYTTVLTHENGLPLTASAQIVNTETSDVATDCNSGNDSASATVISGNFPNVWVVKDCPTSATKGSVVTCTLRYGNNGNADAFGVTLDDTLPANVVAIGPTSFDLGIVEFGDTGTKTVSFTIDDCGLVGQTLVNHAHIDLVPHAVEGGEPAPDANDFDNASAASVQILQSGARLDVAVFASRPAIEQGEFVTFTGEFAASGSEDVIDGVISMSYPANAELASFTPGGVVDATAHTITWSQLGFVSHGSDGDFYTLPAGPSGTVAFTVKATQGSGTLVGSAVVSAQNVCPIDPADAVDVLVDGPGLHVTKAASAHVVCNEGEGTVRWSIFVSNTGSTAIDGIKVVDTLPGGLGLVANSLSGRGADASALPNLKWNVGTLRPGEGLELAFETPVPTSDGALVTNTARVTYAGSQGTVAILSNEVPVRVQCGNGFNLTKAWDAGCDAPGAPIGVSIHWTNDSNLPVASVTISDAIGGFGNVTTDGQVADGVITWTLTDVAPGASGTVHWTGTPTSAASGDVLSDTAVAAIDGFAPQTSNTVGTVIISCAHDAAHDPDQNPCTGAACDPGLGCIEVPNVPADTQCSDGDQCTTADHCDAGACVGGGTLSCSDDNICTKDSCDPKTGCGHVDIGDFLCDDGIECTVDSCSPTLGCQNAPNNAFCTDDSRCTENTCNPEAAPGTDGCQVTILPEPPGGAHVACGTGVCAQFEGDVTCQADGSESSTCDPAYAAVIDNTVCSDQIAVVYAIVEDKHGKPAGTIRCTHTVSGGLIACDSVEGDPATLKVYPDLMCPGFAPVTP
ncbi:MAG: hypothetical protein U1F43_14170 [Myxococcota bacterium]